MQLASGNGLLRASCSVGISQSSYPEPKPSALNDLAFGNFSGALAPGAFPPTLARRVFAWPAPFPGAGHQRVLPKVGGRGLQARVFLARLPDSGSA